MSGGWGRDAGGAWATEFPQLLASRQITMSRRDFLSRRSLSNEGGLPLRGWVVQGCALPLFASLRCEFLSSAATTVAVRCS